MDSWAVKFSNGFLIVKQINSCFETDSDFEISLEA